MNQVELTTKTIKGVERPAVRYGPDGRVYVCAPDGDCTEATRRAVAWAEENGLAPTESDEEVPPAADDGETMEADWHSHPGAADPAKTATILDVEEHLAGQRRAEGALHGVGLPPVGTKESRLLTSGLEGGAVARRSARYERLRHGRSTGGRG